MLALTVAFLTVAARADQISIDESQMVWTQPMQFVSGMLFLCQAPPANFFTGPCGGGQISDIIIFNNTKHQVVFLSNGNDADANPEPADVPFDHSLGSIVNPRYIVEPAAVGGVSTFTWIPGPDGPGFYGAGNSWVITSDAPESVPEPSGVLLLFPVLLLIGMARYHVRTSRV